MAETHTDREKAAIAEVLDTYRDIIRWKVDGVSLHDATRHFVASATNLLGVVKHLVYVERYWFQVVLACDANAMPPWREDPGFEWRIENNESIDVILQLYATECERSREVFNNLESLDSEFPRRDERLTARGILLHVIEEIARHAGHMDIIRELIDDATGWGPDDE
jgi:uncharacterized damage-inducible protein DinB